MKTKFWNLLRPPPNWVPRDGLPYIPVNVQRWRCFGEELDLKNVGFDVYIDEKNQTILFETGDVFAWKDDYVRGGTLRVFKNGPDHVLELELG